MQKKNLPKNITRPFVYIAAENIRFLPKMDAEGQLLKYR